MPEVPWPEDLYGYGWLVSLGQVLLLDPRMMWFLKHSLTARPCSAGTH